MILQTFLNTSFAYFAINVQMTCICPSLSLTITEHVATTSIYFGNCFILLTQFSLTLSSFPLTCLTLTFHSGYKSRLPNYRAISTEKEKHKNQ